MAYALSEPPAGCPIYAVPGFMGDDECDILLAIAQKQNARGALGVGLSSDDTLEPHECAVIEAFEQRLAQLTGCQPHAGDGRVVFKLSTASTGCRDSSGEDDEDELLTTTAERACRVPGFPMGLHVDTHSEQRKRFASVILYLNTIPPGCGGETVFPHLVSEGAALLQNNVTHTHLASLTRPTTGADVAPAAANLLAAAQAVCECAKTPNSADIHEENMACVRAHGKALAVCPKKDLCILFYTRHPSTHGQVDANSWHGGARVADGYHKWILQKFMTVPLFVSARDDILTPGPLHVAGEGENGDGGGGENLEGVRGMGRGGKRNMQEEDIARYVELHCQLPCLDILLQFGHDRLFL